MSHPVGTIRLDLRWIFQIGVPMRPKSLSASAAAVFEACPARFHAEYILRAPDLSSEAADLGTVCHAALEDFVAAGHEPPKDWPILEAAYFKHYEATFEDDSRKAEGLSMVRTWHERTDFVNRVVLSTEKKSSFDIPTPFGPIPFNYIWDRCDLLEGPWCAEGGVRVEVTDYKTVSRPISPEGLKDKIQARCYGLAAQIAFPDAEQIWVTFDLLRYEPVGIVFTRDENVATWKYLKKLALRVLESEPVERLNGECHWCLRRCECTLLGEHVEAGGILSMGDVKEVSRKRHELGLKAKALAKVVEELDDFLVSWAEKEELLEWDVDDLHVALTARKTRTIDNQRAVELIGPELLQKYGNLTMTAVDKMLKDKALEPQVAAQVRDLIGVKFSEPTIKTFEKNPIDSSL